MRSQEEDDALMPINDDPPAGSSQYTSREPPLPPPPPPPSFADAIQILPVCPPIAMRLHRASTKPKSRLFYFFLQALVMAFVVILFFIFVGIAAIVLIHICIVSGALHRWRRRRTRFPNFYRDNVEFGVGLSPKDLQKLPCFNYEVGVDRSVSRDCAVCLEGFREGDRCRILPGCKHLFHGTCVDAWLIKVPTCPICRAAVELGLGLGSEDCRGLKAIRV